MSPSWVRSTDLTRGPAHSMGKGQSFQQAVLGQDPAATVSQLCHQQHKQREEKTNWTPSQAFVLQRTLPRK